MQLTVPAQPTTAEPAQGRRLRVLDTPAVKSREKSVRACSLACTQLDFSTTAQDRLPREWCSHSGLGRPASVNLIKTIPTDVPVGQPNVDRALLRSSAQVILDCVTLK